MRVLRVCVLAAVLVAVGLAAGGAKHVGADAAKKAQGLYELGLAHMQRGEAERALEQFLQAEKINPYDAEIPNAMGLVYYSMEKYDKAADAYKRALALEPEFGDARHNLGTLYLFLGRSDEAIKEFERALANDLYRNRATTYNSLGWAKLQKGDLTGAEKNFTESIEHDRLFVIAYCNLGQTYVKTGDYKKAVQFLKKAVDLAPQYAEAYLYLGVAQLKLGQNAEAKAALGKAQQFDAYGKFGAQAQEYLRLLP